MQENTWIKEFELPTSDTPKKCAFETLDWIEGSAHPDEDTLRRDLYPGENHKNESLFLSDTGISSDILKHISPSSKSNIHISHSPPLN